MSPTNTCALKDLPCIRDATDDLHKALLMLVEQLVLLDPTPESIEGKILIELGNAIEAYEKVVYPI